MVPKRNIKNILGDNILLNLAAIAGCCILVIILGLLIAHGYTRHEQNIVVPQLQGLQIEEAETILKSQRLHYEIVDSIYKKEAVPGSIIDQKPKPQNKVKAGRAIYLTIYARNPQQIAIPDLKDYSERQAIALLNSLGFNQITIEQVPSQYSGLVISIEYGGKTLNDDEKIPSGAPLKMFVSSNQSQSDSLHVNEEYIVVPGSSRENNSGEEPAKQSNMDESFF